MVRDTSLINYAVLHESGVIGERHMMVIKALNELGEASDTMISHFLGQQDINFSRPRRKELLDKGLVFDAGVRECPISKRQVHFWSLTDNLTNKNNNFIALSSVKFDNIKSKLYDCNVYQLKNLKEFVDSLLFKKISEENER